MKRRKLEDASTDHFKAQLLLEEEGKSDDEFKMPLPPVKKRDIKALEKKIEIVKEIQDEPTPFPQDADDNFSESDSSESSESDEDAALL
jgi:hypothetical protein